MKYLILIIFIFEYSLVYAGGDDDVVAPEQSSARRPQRPGAVSSASNAYNDIDTDPSVGTYEGFLSGFLIDPLTLRQYEQYFRTAVDSCRRNRDVRRAYQQMVDLEEMGNNFLQSRQGPLRAYDSESGQGTEEENQADQAARRATQQQIRQQIGNASTGACQMGDLTHQHNFSLIRANTRAHNARETIQTARIASFSHRWIQASQDADLFRNPHLRRLFANRSYRVRAGNEDNNVSLTPEEQQAVQTLFRTVRRLRDEFRRFDETEGTGPGQSQVVADMRSRAERIIRSSIRDSGQERVTIQRLRAFLDESRHLSSQEIDINLFRAFRALYESRADVYFNAANESTQGIEESSRQIRAQTLCWQHQLRTYMFNIKEGLEDYCSTHQRECTFRDRVGCNSGNCDIQISHGNLWELYYVDAVTSLRNEMRSCLSQTLPTVMSDQVTVFVAEGRVEILENNPNDELNGSQRRETGSPSSGDSPATETATEQGGQQ